MTNRHLTGAVEGVLTRKAFRSGLLAVVAAGFALAVSLSSSFAYEDHVVTPGETLSSIAAHYGFPVDTLAEVNGLSSADDIRVGQVIRVPGRDANAGGGVVATASGQTYVVQAGETLTAIATASGTELARWIALNGLSNANAIYVGQVLQVPEGAAAAAAPDAPARPPLGLVPSGKTHAVAVGDTLSAIADQYNIPLAMWVELNRLSSADAIHVGELLQVPGSSATPPGPGPSTPSTGAVPGGRAHTVQAGETLSHIADHYNIPLDLWVQVNHLSSADSVFAGQVLKIPGAAGPVQQATFTHVVKERESLAGIAATYGISLDEITRINGIENPNLVTIGQVLAVPGPVCRPGTKAQYRVALENAAAEYGIARSVVLGLSWHESGWQQCIVSHANAFGLMQVTPGTGQWALDLGLTDAVDYQVNYIANARMGAAILRDHLIQANWDLRTALAAYYQGFDALYAVGMYEETKVYVGQVLAAIALFE